MHSSLIVIENREYASVIEDVLKKNSEFSSPKFSKSFADASRLLNKTTFNLLIVEHNSKTSFEWIQSNTTKDTEIIVLHMNIPFQDIFLNLKLSGYISLTKIDKSFNLALKRVRINLQKINNETIRLNNLLKIINNKQNFKIALSLKGGIEIIDSEQVVSISKSKNNTEITLLDKQILKVNKPINDFELLLKDFSFYRIHKSHIININHLKQYVKKNNGSIIMNNLSSFPISAGRKSGFNKKIKKVTLNLL